MISDENSVFLKGIFVGAMLAFAWGDAMPELVTALVGVGASWILLSNLWHASALYWRSKSNP